jgi:mannose/fructose/N-acetylgalactosamine-specific phosphotransferase system component IIC
MSNLPGFGRAAIWAGLIALDITGCGPWMISQPMVTGAIFGWLMGQVNVGVLIGGVVQLLWMDVSPVGVGIPFDATSATILAVYLASLQVASSISTMMLALVIAIPFGFLSRWMDHYARRLNTVIARQLESVQDARLTQALSLGILAGLLWSWLRYALFYALAMFAGQKLWFLLQQLTFPEWLNRGLTLAAYLSPVAGLGVGLELFLSEEPERRFQAMRVFKSKG